MQWFMQMLSRHSRFYLEKKSSAFLFTKCFMKAQIKAEISSANEVQHEHVAKVVIKDLCY